MPEEGTHSIASDSSPAGPMLVKLVPPRVPSWYVERQSLAERLDDAARYQLTTVVAGAGFGKSTQLAARAAANGWVWYTIDHSDRSPVKCAGGVLAALRRRLPRLPWLVLPVNAGSDEEAVGDGLASLLAHALEDELEDDVVLVLDDVHELDGAPAALRLVESLVRYAPVGLHLVLSSRHELPFSVTRLRGRGEVLDVVSADLAFSEDDTSARLTLASSAVDGELARSIHEATDGWPAAVQMAAEMLRADRPIDRERLLDALSSRGGPLYSYLVEEVFAGESPERTELVRTAAQFERVTPDICEALGCADAATTLIELARRGLVTAPPTGADDWYTLHALVREFVLETWPFSASGLRALRRRAARSFETMGRYREALECLTAAADGAGIVRLVRKRWRELTDQAELDVLVAAGAVLPPELRADIAFTVAHAHTLRGEFDRALEWLSDVRDDVDAQGALAFQVGMVHMNRDEPREAIDWLLRAIPPDTGEQRTLEQAAMVHAFITYQLLWLGRLDEARTHAEQGFEAALRLPKVLTPLAETHMALSHVDFEEGDVTGARAHVDAAVEIAEQLGNVLATCSARNRRSWVGLEQGLLTEAVDDASHAVTLADRVGFSLFQAWAPATRADAYFALGLLDEAEADFSLARDVQERLGSSAVSVPLTGLGDVHRVRGELSQAHSAYERALANAERSGSVRDRTEALVGLAYTLVEDDTDAAQQAATAAVELSGGSLHPRALVAQGWLFLHEGNRAAARSNADVALADGRHRGSPMRIAEALELLALCEAEPSGDLLEEAHTIWTTIGARVRAAQTALALARLARDDARVAAAEDALRRLGIRRIGAGAGLLREIPSGSAPPVAIRTLGHFAVVREGDAVGSTEWQSKKARDLLKILVAQRGHALSRDALLELLWPDEDPRRTSNRLSVALNVVRTVLDPSREHGQDHYVAGGQDALRLVLQHVVVDLEDFLAAASAGVRAFRAGDDGYVEILESAETAYAGDFLEEDRYEDWASACRDEARAAYAEVLRTLAEVEAQGEVRSATYHLRALALDPYDEEMHLALVSMLIASGRHGEARRAYRQYVDRMREIDVEPSAFPSDAARAKPALSEP